MKLENYMHKNNAINNNSLWERYCHYLCACPNIGVELDISRMSFPDSFLCDIKPRLDSALKEMSDLESGAIANVDENRMVGHYWLRNASLAPSKEIQRSITTELQKIKKFASQVHNGDISSPNGESYTHVLIVGIGGSALGPQLLSDALWEPSHKMQLMFCDNTDPDGINRLLAQLGKNLIRTITLIVSKSGGTIETRNGALEIQEAYTREGLDYRNYFAAITVENSKLDQQAKEQGWLERFYIWDWIGGRTSIFSAVGLLPACLQGIDIDELLNGAKQMDIETRVGNELKNPALLLAAMWLYAGNERGAKDMVILPYKDRLLLFSRYLQQLVMESLGKQLNRKSEIVHQGISVFGNKGSTDQHAYVQQLRDGLNNFFATFIEIRNDFFNENSNSLEVEPNITSGDYLSGFFQGTRAALTEGGRDSITITLDKLNPFSLGALIALYDRAVGFYASLIDINAYHQPGVEAGKKAAANVIELQKSIIQFMQNNKNTYVSAPHVAKQIDKQDEVETVFRILNRLSCNPHKKISRRVIESPIKTEFLCNRSQG